VFDIVCVSHLRWNFVWQRPQHLLSRMARAGRVLFIEEPINTDDVSAPRLEIEQKAPGITVIRLLQPASKPCRIGHGDPATAQSYEALINSYLAENGFENVVLWLYTPLAWHFASIIPHKLLVFDVMDHLAGFKNAPAQLIDYDPIVIRKADLVFTGGLSLYESRRPLNKNTYLFPSGVDIEHFAAAKNKQRFPVPEDLAGLNGPILGYYGVIDERTDLNLLTYLSESHPEWDIVMLGPIAKISDKDLPRGQNLHYLGMKQYEQLPAYLAHFDVALIPFALNDATRFVSPTKTLEYMAAHKPIVSTPIHDVMALYGSVVRVGETPEAFAAHVEEALVSDHSALLAREQHLLQQNTWDSIASRMQQAIRERFAQLNARKEAS
jgi:UDP-galactopyranose mutase